MGRCFWHRKETHCEFCDCTLPDWKKVLTPQCGANAPAVMNVNFDGRTYSFEVKPGPDGYRQFTEAIRRAFSLPDDSELNITFTCDEPSAGWEPEPAPPSKPPSRIVSLASANCMLAHASALLVLSNTSSSRRASQLLVRPASSPGRPGPQLSSHRVALYCLAVQYAFMLYRRALDPHS
jgi:hypothetical protein